ncbi:MAG: DUF1501 domain-containing protein [Planctomycetota bacterium]|nr:MAG: DUF1501 domain-containing protein [Planctomycetota bacterium]
MFSVFGPKSDQAGRATRRELLRAGALSLLGLSSVDLAALRAAAPRAGRRPARSCVFVFLFGGPSHIDLWDMKPDAPAEIRGEFRPAATNVPGIQICEHLPKLAAQMDKLCLLRSMEHRMPVHGPACSEMFSGRPYFGPPVTDQARPEDWPSLASLTMRFAEQRGPLPPSVVLPWYIQFAGQDKRIAGQTGGRMGDMHNPFLVKGDPSDQQFEVQGIKLAEDVGLDRVVARRELLHKLKSSLPEPLEPGLAVQTFDRHVQTAFSMLGDIHAHQAFRLDRETAALRERYGETKFGQSLLLARRLVEAGVSLVTVNWDDETRNEKVSPFWDTHDNNFPSLKQRLAPRFDQSFSAFLADLDQRGLLESTLVVVTGEFGRTPKIGQVVQNGMTAKTGRDHWPHAFTVLLAGGGVRGGQVYGSTTKTGGYVQDKPVSPADLSATVLSHLGVDPDARYEDEFQQMHRSLSVGRPISDLG